MCFNSVVNHGPLEGNNCQGFIKEQNLQKFSKILEETTMLKNVIDKVIKVLCDIRNVYSSCCGSTLDPKYEDIITSFKNSWQALIDEPILKLSWTPKAHHIADHFVEYFKDYII